MTLGTTKALTLADARRLAAQARTEVEAGKNPHAEKLAARHALVSARQAAIDRTKLDSEYLWEKYMELAASQLRSRKAKDRLFRRFILPVIGNRSIAEVKRAHALEVVDGQVTVGFLRQADQVLQEGAAFFNWLVERKHVDRNVFAGIREAQLRKTIRTRVLSDEELGEIWMLSEPEGRWGHWIKLLILTGCRNAEVRDASWAE